MINTKILSPNRVRRITGSFAFIEHRFLRNGFWDSLTHHELLLYLFLILASDRNGISYYSYDKICSLLRISTDEYLQARNALIDKDLIAFDGYFFQVLSLPEKLANKPLRLLKSQQEMEKYDPATICNLIGHSLKGD
ncbi:MAG: helix-turn-helix domain-containing protein [Deltaproteobacteria bacterium]|nr:helix-turn-helix domain-containing protein [Deltaproteobacteria bacterium]